MAAVESMGTHQMVSPAIVDRIDARPILPVADSSGSLWDRAALQRNDICRTVKSFFEAHGITAWVRTSQPGVYPLVVAVDSWLPVSQSDVAAKLDRSSLAITLSVAPHFESPILYRVDLSRHAKHFSAEHWELATDELHELLSYLLQGGRKPMFFRNRTPIPVQIAAAFLPFVHGPQNRLIAEARPRFWTLPTALLLGGWLLAALWAGNVEPFDEYGEPTRLGYLAPALVALAAALGSYLLTLRRPVIHAIPKQSAKCPRREYCIDSWHVSVPCAGEPFDDFKQRIYRAAQAVEQGVEATIEVHQSITPRGVEERERIVLGMGQATLHVHVYRFGSDAFVGWDSHLNWNRWAEGDVVSSTVANKCKVEYKALQVGLHVPSDFDLMEANVLTETTHRRLVNEIKSFLKEREIEADLDFRIIRGDRSRALEEGKDRKTSKS